MRELHLYAFYLRLLHLQELQKLSDVRMREMEYYLDALNTSMITLELSEKGQVLNANDAFLKLLGYDQEQLKNLQHVDLMHEEDVLQKDYQTLWEQIRAGKQCQTMLRRKTAQQEIKWFRSYYFPKVSEDGTIEKIIELSSDFTKEKLQEEKIVNNEKILHERVKSIEDKEIIRYI